MIEMIKNFLLNITNSPKTIIYFSDFYKILYGYENDKPFTLEYRFEFDKLFTNSIRLKLYTSKERTMDNESPHCPSSIVY